MKSRIIFMCTYDMSWKNVYWIDSLTTTELPQYWNEQYKNWMDVTVPDDKQGCLQDVHWSHGSFGYFPTYSLGSFYAAQFYARQNRCTRTWRAGQSSGNTKPCCNGCAQGACQGAGFYTSAGLCASTYRKTT